MLSAGFIPIAIVKEQGKANKTGPTKETLEEMPNVPKEIMKESKQPEEISKQIDADTPVKMEKPNEFLDAGKVVTTVFKAKNIEKKGMFGKADLYVKLTLGKQKAKSATVKIDHNPEWNFKASFDIDPKISEDIQIEVFDEDLGKDDSLGHWSYLS